MKKMSNFVIPLLAITIAMFVGACSSVETIPTPSLEATPSISSRLPSSEDDNLDSVPGQRETHVNIVDVSPYSDGVYKIIYSYENDNSIYTGFLGKNGEIISANPLPYDVPYCENRGPTDFQFYSVEGTLLYDHPQKDDLYYLCSGEEYFMIAKQTSGYDAISASFGFMNSDGSWCTEPIEIPNISTFEGHKYCYLGEGMFALNYRTRNGYSGYIFIDALTNESFDCGSLSIKSNFADGVLVAKEIGGGVCTINRQGEKLYLDIGGSVIYSSSDGIFAGEEVADTGYTIYKNTTYYDIHGNKLLDLSRYKVLEILSGFNDGYATVLLLGADSKIYVAAIDEDNGELAFEPQVWFYVKSSHSRYDFYSILNTRMLTVKSNNPSTTLVLMDLCNGNSITELKLPNVNLPSYKKFYYNGLICIFYEDHFIFYDDDGNEIRPYVKDVV